MNTYYAFDENAANSITETLTVTGGIVRLRHIPQEGSVTIAGFVETNSLTLSGNKFRVDYYDANGNYRDASRRIFFDSAKNGSTVTVNYTAVGTPVTAADMNEIKLHMENSNLHGSHPITAAQVQQFVDHMNNASIHGGGGSASVQVATYSKAGIVRPGWGLSIDNSGTVEIASWVANKVTFLGSTDYLGSGDGHGELVFYTPEQRFYIWDGDSGEWIPFNSGGGAGTQTGTLHTKTIVGPVEFGDEDVLWGWVITTDGDAPIKIPSELYNNRTVAIYDVTHDRALVKGTTPYLDWGRGDDWCFYNDKIYTLYYTDYPTTLTIVWYT